MKKDSSKSDLKNPDSEKTGSGKRKGRRDNKRYDNISWKEDDTKSREDESIEK